MRSLILLCFILFIYFIPAIVASRREHQNKMAIVVTNVFLGWTFLGWVVALIWAFTEIRPKQLVDPLVDDQYMRKSIERSRVQ